MPRKTWKTLYGKWPELSGKSFDERRKYINGVIFSSQHQGTTFIRSNYSQIPGRELDITSRESIKTLGAASITARIATAIQLSGIEEEEPCSCCNGENKTTTRKAGQARSTEPPFAACIRLENEQLGRCANCVFLREHCTYGDQGMLLII